MFDKPSGPRVYQHDPGSKDGALTPLQKSRLASGRIFGVSLNILAEIHGLTEEEADVIAEALENIHD